MAAVAARAAASKLADDVVVIDVSGQLVITDCFVIASASNERQVNAIVDEVEEKMRQAGYKPARREGAREGRWTLLDYVDIDRGGPTYTKDTLRDLHTLNPDSDLYFITGADALASILSWQDLEELFAMARFVGVSRPGYELGREHLTGVLDGLPEDALTLVEIPALAISSTDCRRRAAEGRPLWYLMPDGVVQYISKRELYCKPRDDT